MTALIAGALALYTGLLVISGRIGQLRARSADHFVTAGRRLGFGAVFVLVTAMWTAWIFVTELDEGYAVGISAVWFGIAVILMSLVVAWLFVTPFRRLGYVTNSGLIGERFGPAARTLSGLVIGLTFPIFALGNVLAAAALLHALFGWPLVLAEAATLAVMLAYVALGGLTSLVYAQSVNLAVMLAGLLAVSAYLVVHGGSAAGPAVSWPGAGPWNWVGVGPATIAVWIVSDLVNVVSAQVEFQAVTAVERPVTARRAVYASTGVLALVALAAAYIGLRTHAVVPGGSSGVLAFPRLVLAVLPGPFRILAVAGVWAAALTWSAPLLFSGASSLGLDVAQPIAGRTDSVTGRRLIRWMLPIQAAAVLVYTLLRPGDLAWWSVFGLTVRNAAIFAPTVGLLLWRKGDNRAAVIAMALGVATGLGWNAATGFSPTVFLLGINPAWLGTAVSILVFLAGSLWASRGRTGWAWPRAPYGYVGFGLLAAAAAVLAFDGETVVRAGWAGMAVLAGAVGLLLALMACCRDLASGDTSAVREKSV
jgi:SSS family solute:Na+ symporter